MESEGKKDEVRGKGGIYVPEKAATGDARAFPDRGDAKPGGANTNIRITCSIYRTLGSSSGIAGMTPVELRKGGTSAD